MNCKCEKIEDNKIKLTFFISPEKFEEGMKYSYNKNKNRINIQGFRKGKAPRKIIEMNYGKEIFYDDAINFVIPEAYEAAIKEQKLDVVSRPKIDIEEVSPEKGAVIQAEVYIKPQINIKEQDYKGVKYNKINIDVTEEEINKEIEKVREQNARILTIENRNIQDKDIVTIDFEGFIDNVPFEGGRGENYSLTIGSKTFIDTFEDQIIGHKIGDKFEVNVKFPSDYPQEDLKGKDVVFKVEIKDIKTKELPEVNDDFAQDTSEFNTLEEYKKDIKAKLSEAKKENSKSEKEKQIIMSILEKINIDIPEIMIENQIDNMINEFSHQIKMQGLSLESYLQYVNQDMNSLRNAYKDNATYQVKARLILEEVAKKENMSVTEEEIEEEISRISLKYSMEKEKLKEVLRESDKKGLQEDIKTKKALDLIIENAKEI